VGRIIYWSVNQFRDRKHFKEIQNARHRVVHILSCITKNDISPQRAAHSSIDFLFHWHSYFRKWGLLFDIKLDMSPKVVPSYCTATSRNIITRLLHAPSLSFSSKIGPDWTLFIRHSLWREEGRAEHSRTVIHC
jgi:hypothetical protein